MILFSFFSELIRLLSSAVMVSSYILEFIVFILIPEDNEIVIRMILLEITVPTSASPFTHELRYHASAFTCLCFAVV